MFIFKRDIIALILLTLKLSKTYLIRLHKTNLPALTYKHKERITGNEILALFYNYVFLQSKKDHRRLRNFVNISFHDDIIDHSSFSNNY